MRDRLHTKLFTAVAAALAVAAMAPMASAKSSPQGNVRIPAWLAHIHYPGTSTEPTVYMAGPIAIPARLLRTQYPGTSSEPTVFVAAGRSSHAFAVKVRNGQLEIPAWLARIQYPGTSSEPTVLVNNVASPEPAGGGFDWTSAMIGAGGGLAVAFAGAGGLLALRRRRTLAHA